MREEEGCSSDSVEGQEAGPDDYMDRSEARRDECKVSCERRLASRLGTVIVYCFIQSYLLIRFVWYELDTQV
jgi:hypothetical protein